MPSKDRERGRRWKRLREAVLRRDGHRCAWCGAKATHADHVVPRSLGGPDTLANLVASCARCNQSRGARLGPPRPASRNTRTRDGW